MLLRVPWRLSCVTNLFSINAAKKFSMTSHNSGGNRSRVVREALVTLADMEARLDKIDADPAFQKMMADSDQAIRKYRNEALWKVIIASWGIAFFELLFPATHKPYRLLRIPHRAAYDHSGSHY